MRQVGNSFKKNKAEKKPADKTREYCNWIVTKIIVGDAEMYLETMNQRKNELKAWQ